MGTGERYKERGLEIYTRRQKLLTIMCKVVTKGSTEMTTTDSFTEEQRRIFWGKGGCCPTGRHAQRTVKWEA